MFNEKLKRAICGVGTAVMLCSVIVPTSASAATVKADKANDKYAQRFVDIYNTIKDTNTGYFDENGVPYHSIETLMVEAPDQGHESTSEAASYLIWLEAMAGKMTGNYQGLSDAWDVVENYYIPTSKDQPGQTDYNPSSPATYAAEYDDPSKYPSQLVFGAAVGSDPIANELKSAYGNQYMYGMHWLIDVDNFYGYGLRGDRNSTKPSYINTYQRGKEESCFETVPQPCWDDLKAGGRNGYLDLFTKDNGYSAQWKYTDAPDADARLIQAMYGARNAAKEDGVNIKNLTDKAAKMGDYLRYSMFDKYFRKIGQPKVAASNGRDAQHYLLSWYYAWGGSTTQSWSWRIGCSHSHFGYQSPFAAYLCSEDSDFIGKGSTGKSDWAKSLQRQKELYTWLQSEEGGIAGGCTNSWNGAYEDVPSSVSTFYGMGYTEHPVYADPGSNQWFGMQCWSMQRMCEYYYVTGDPEVKELVNKWAAWANKESTVTDKAFSIPSNLKWEGQPDTWREGQTIANWKGNSNLHVRVSSYGEDVGVAGSLANALLYVAAANNKYGGEVKAYRDKALGILDCMHDNYMDDKGVAVEAPWDAANRFFEQKVYIPSGWTGTMPNGDKIDSNATFLSIRSQYKQDADFDRVQAAYQNGETVMMKYHRFWAQVEYAVANGVASNLAKEIGIPTGDVDPTTPPTTTAPATTAPATTTPVKPSPSPVQPSPSPVKPSPTPSPSEEVKPSQNVGEYDVKVNTGNGQWSITNSKGSVSLKDITIRYYIKSEGTAADVVYIDNAGLSLSKAPYYASLTSDVSAKVVKMANPTANADAYVEIKFDSNYDLDSSANLQLGIRMAKADWSNFDQTNDYSYTNGAVVYVNGTCVSGNDL